MENIGSRKVLLLADILIRAYHFAEHFFLTYILISVISYFISSDVAEDLPVPPNTRVSSPTPSVTQEHAEIMLPHAEPILPEHMGMAREWIPVSMLMR